MEYNYFNPLSVTSQFSFCGLPFRLDTYAGCAFACSYCFARVRGGNIKSKKLKVADPNLIITKFKNALKGNSMHNGILTEYIRNNMPVHFGGMSDPFQSIEIEYKSSLKVLKYLASLNYPIVISTKSTLLAKEPYLSILKSFSNVVVQFSFSTLKEEITSVIEPNVVKPTELMITVEKLSENGVKTAIRWQPYIPFLSESPKEFISKISNLGVFHLGFEHLKFPLENNNSLNSKILKLTDVNLLEYYRNNNSNYDGRELVLPLELKLEMIKQVKKEANKYSMTFGAADNEFQFLSDTNCCCSGVDQIEGFENWKKFQIGFAIKKSINNGEQIFYSSIENEWKPKGAIDKHINSKSRLTKIDNHNSVERYIKDRWENLNSPFNPTNFLGVTYNGEIDKNGMKIYNWVNIYE